MIKIYNPANAELLQEVSKDNLKSISEKLESLRHGQSSWKNTPIESRLEIIKRFGDIIRNNIEDLASLLSNETGKPIKQARNEISGAHNRIDHLLGNANKWLKPEQIEIEGPTLESITYEPLGVIANISAWNYPYNVGYNVFLYALAAGNGVLYKPSEYSSLTGLAIAGYLHQAGIPKDVFQCVIGGPEIGQSILDLDLDGYFFTGSYSTGRYIASQLASKLVPIQLELGGKDPLYVMDDVTDIKQAAINAAEGSFYNAGQSCCAVERIYVSDKIYDDFIGSFVEEVASYKIGNPLTEATFIGPLTRSAQLDVLKEQVDEAQMKGANVVLGGQPIEGPGNYFQPTVVIDTDHTMRIMKEESFGPVIGIQKVTSDDEAISLMNDSDYGLTAAVFGTNEKRVYNILNSMNSGTVYWNCCDRVSPNLPWSGRKNSGLGSTLASQGIRAFVQPKSYHIRRPG